MNKVYIKIALALLKVKQQVSIDPEEAKEAENIMIEALALAQKHAEDTEDYQSYNQNGTTLHFKNFNDIEIGKFEFTIPNPDSYADIVNMLWDPNGAKNYGDLFDKGSFYRTYNENLAIIQQYYIGLDETWNTYCYALASKFQLSEDETAIVLTSSDMNPDDDASYEKYKNPIVESANKFNPKFNSEKYTRNEKLFQFYINLMAFFIKKESDYVKITHIGSLDHDHIFFLKDIHRLVTSKKMVDVINLREIFKKE
ncbi:fam-a protein [Plasmodium vinckei vinckei]|uniref:Fam-a protein n=1 Tax=Plasmodium vinckei vinckei TaxID=54757 RepID=A0A449BNB2_PLAVN|nr:fam-a protein [Plasmodium vinckei vinckei]VEV54915.1 fam-a protein [Plasmodium vinckei vinckei]